MANSFRVRFEVDGDGKVQAQLASIVSSATPATKSVKALADEVLTVGDNLDSAGARAREYQRQMVVLDNALKKNIISMREYSDLAAKAWQQSPDGEKWLRYGEQVGSGLLAIGGVAAAAMAIVIKNTMDAQQELAQLGAVLKSTGQDANWSRDQVVDMAEQIAKASTYSGGEVTNAATRLLSYSGIAKTNFKDALQIAIDQAARLGSSVEQSAEIVGRALESPTKAAAALSQQGFGKAFTPAVRASIKALEDAGDAAAAQKIVMDILNESYEGAAAAARDSFGGALKALGNTLADVTTGDDGSLADATKALNELIETLNDPDVKKGFDNVISGMLKLVDYAAQATTGVSGLIGKYTSWLSSKGIMPADDSTSVADLTTRRSRLVSIQERLSGPLGGLLGGDDTIAKVKDEIAQIDELIRTAPWRTNAKVNILENGAQMPGYALKDAVTKPDAETDKAAEARAARIKRATETMSSAQRAWTTELGSVDNPIIDEYNKRLDQIVDKSEAASRAGVPTSQIDAFTASMKELAQQIKDKQIAEFQKEFDEATQAMVASLDGPAATAFGKYTKSLAEVQKLLDAGVITADEFSARQKALANEMNSGAIQTIKDLAEERLTLTLNADQLEVYNRLKQAGVDASSAYGRAIAETTLQLQKERAAVAVINDLRSSTTEFASDALTNFGSAGDAVENYVNRVKRLAADMLADAGVKWLFSALSSLFGSTSTYTGDGLGSGSTSGFGNNLDTFTSTALYGFGGGRAAGGGVSSGRIYEVTEGGAPELYRQGDKTYLLPGSDGVVMPASAAAAGASGGSAPRVVINMKDGDGGSLQGEVTSQSWDGDTLNLEMVVSQSIARDAARNGVGIRTQQRVLGLNRQGVKLG